MMNDMDKKNEKLEAIRGEIPFKIKEQVDAWFDAIDRAYELGCRYTEQKLNLPGIMQGLSLDEVRFRATRFAHECRLRGVSSNLQTVELYDELYSSPSVASEGEDTVAEAWDCNDTMCLLSSAVGKKLAICEKKCVRKSSEGQP